MYTSLSADESSAHAISQAIHPSLADPGAPPSPQVASPGDLTSPPPVDEEGKPRPRGRRGSFGVKDSIPRLSPAPGREAVGVGGKSQASLPSSSSSTNMLGSLFGMGGATVTPQRRTTPPPRTLRDVLLEAMEAGRLATVMARAGGSEEKLRALYADFALLRDDGARER
jgi:hypothetical protein